MATNFHIGIMGNLFSGKTTLMQALNNPPYKNNLEALIDNGEVRTFSERVEKGSLADECLALFYQDRPTHIFPTEMAFLYMRTFQQREIRHLMTRENSRGVIVIEDRPFLDGPEVFVRRMMESKEMPAPHARLYQTILKQILEKEHIRLPDLLVYLRTEPATLEKRRQKRALEGDGHAASISSEYLFQIHSAYEKFVTHWKKILRKYREIAIVPPDIDLIVLPAEIDMYDHPDYVHVAAGTIREKMRRILASRREGE